MLVLITAGISGKSQISDCHVVSDDVQALQELNPACNFTINYVPDQNFLDHTPELIVNINIHFVLRNDGSGNFKEPGNALSGELDGVEAAEALIAFCNTRLGGFEQYNQHMAAYHVPESRIRFRLYSEPDNPADPFGGVHFIYDDETFDQGYRPGRSFLNAYKQNFTVYGDRVIDVFMTEQADTNEVGFVFTSGAVLAVGSTNGTAMVSGMYNDHITDTSNSGGGDRDIVNYRGILIHEVFHLLGLDHSFVCDNPCADVDLNVTADCNTPGVDCTFDQNGAGCANRYTTPSNNIMRHGPTATAITPCQLGIIQHFLRVIRPGYLEFDFCEISEPDIVIQNGENIVWNSSRYLRGHLVIEPGATLTIQCLVGFPEFAHVSVKPGGRLIIDGGLLTGNCDRTWEGVIAQGIPTNHQFLFSQQGVVELINDGAIEHARVAINAPDGGIVRIDSASFTNNHTSVAVHSYVYILNGQEVNNRGFVRNSTFTLTDDYRFDSFFTHTYAGWVKGLQFTGCEYRDERDFGAIPPSIEEDNIGSGLLLQDASAFVSNCSFNELLFGLEAQGLETMRNFVVRDSEFNDCYTGIHVRAVDNFEVKNNTFQVGGYDKPVPGIIQAPNRHCGLFIDYSTGFTVERNTFEKSSQATGITAIGTCSQNTNAIAPGSEDTHDEYNEIWKNTFTGMDIANLANGKNAGNIELQSGLTYLCNTQAESGNDIRVVDGTIAPRQIDPEQVAAANTFSDCTGGYVHIDNLLAYNNIRYHYWDGDPDEDPVCSPPFRVERIVANQNSCSDSEDPPTPEEIQIVKLIFDSLSQKYLQLHQSYMALLDGGDRPGILSLISGATPQNREDVKDQLLGYSPFLSETSLSKVLDNTVFTDPQKAEVLEAHPEGLQTYVLWSAIESYGFDTPEQSALENGRQQRTIRDSIEMELATTHGRLHRTGNMLIQYESAKDTADLPAVRDLLQGKHSLAAAYKRAESYLQIGNTSAAAAVLDTIEMQYTFSGLELDEQKYWLDLKRLAVQLKSEERGWGEMTGSESEFLQGVADYSGSVAGIQAQNILMNLSGKRTHYHEPIVDSGAQAMRMPPPGSEAAAGDLPKKQVLAFPNPTTGWINFRYGLNEEKPAELRIFNLNGIMLETLRLEGKTGRTSWNGDSRPPGIYIYRLFVNGQPGESGRFIVIKGF